VWLPSNAELSAAPLAGVVTELCLGTNRHRQRASRRPRAGETGKWTELDAKHRRNFQTAIGGRALAGPNGPGYGPQSGVSCTALLAGLAPSALSHPRGCPSSRRFSSARRTPSLLLLSSARLPVPSLHHTRSEVHSLLLLPSARLSFPSPLLSSSARLSFPFVATSLLGATVLPLVAFLLLAELPRRFSSSWLDCPSSRCGSPVPRSTRRFFSPCRAVRRHSSATAEAVQPAG